MIDPPHPPTARQRLHQAPDESSPIPTTIPLEPGMRESAHILIGIGGTGGKVLREFRKDVYRRHGGTSVAGTRMGYLYVDSSKADLDNSADWNVLGRSVQLPTSSRLSIEVPDMLSIVDNPTAYPGITPWLGSRGLWQEYLSAFRGLKAAGYQRRRVGRVLFAHNVRAFIEAIGSLFNEVVDGGSRSELGNPGVTFHVICGLAGGTGSGSVVDAVTQIGHFISSRGDTLRHRLVVYCYLPETDPPRGRAERYYFGNGYAALQELNALSTGHYLPHDVAADRPFKEGQFTPFDACYVFTNETEHGKHYHADEVPALLSRFLYQKIVAVDRGDWNDLVWKETLERYWSGVELPSVWSPRVWNPRPERSVRFMSFGIKRIANPEEEIQEYLAYSYAIEAIKQLHFNNWSHQIGFIDRVRNDDFSGYREDVKLALFRCSWDHLILSRPILKADERKNWLEAGEYWRVGIAEAAEDVVANVDKKFWLKELFTIISDQLEKEYRGDGLSNFYLGKKQTIDTSAREIVQRLEAELMSGLLGGGLSITEIAASRTEGSSFAGIVEVIRDELISRLEKCTEKAESQRKQATNLMNGLIDIEKQYEKIWIFDPLRHRHALLEEYKQALGEWAEARTKAEGYDYAEQLIRMVLTKMYVLSEEISKLVAGLNRLFNEFEKQAAKRCADGAKPDFNQLEIKYYHAEAVKDHLCRMRVNEAAMFSLCTKVHHDVHISLTRESRQDSCFAGFNEIVSWGTFEHKLLETCTMRSRKDHDAIGYDEKNRLFGVDLVGRLLEDFPGAAQQEEFARHLLSQATTLAALNETERNNVTGNEYPRSLIRRSVSVIGKGLGRDALPGAKGLQTALKAALPTEAGEMHFVPATLHPNEVTLVSLTNLMPLRCVSRVGFLRMKYDELLGSAAGNRSDAMFLHSQGDGSEFPPLFALSMKEVRRKGCQLLLEAEGCGLLQSCDTPGSSPVLIYRELDEHQVATDTLLGKDLPACLDAFTPKIFARIQAGIEAALPKADKAVFLKRVAEALKAIQAHNGLEADDRAEFLAAGQRLETSVQGTDSTDAFALGRSEASQRAFIQQ